MVNFCNLDKTSKSVSKQSAQTQTQLIIVTDNCHTGVLHECAKVGLAISAGPFLLCKDFTTMLLCWGKITPPNCPNLSD